MQNASWVVPALQVIHILSVSVLMAAMVMLDLRMLGVVQRRQTIAQTASRFLPWLWPALGVLALTGALLTITEPSRELMSPAFRAKMLMIVIVGALAATIGRSLRRDARYWDDRAGAAILVAAFSLILWLGILTAGRWIAYVEPL
jgi:prepilin signal peptidase PulO-like enzyme (type II secretory pathway)